MGKSSLQRELDKYFKELSDEDFNIRKVTKSAFTQSRRDLKPEAFLELNDLVIKDFYEDAPYLGYNNHRVLSVDSTDVLLPNHSETISEFGQAGYGPNGDSQKVMGRVSMLYDCANYLTLDVQLSSLSTNERELMLNHLNKMAPNDLVLADRGYPSLFVFFTLHSKGVQFCIRMKENWWNQVRVFRESNQDQEQIELVLSDTQLEQYREQYPDIEQTIKCRLIKVYLDNGVTEILCTSLLDEQIYPFEDFKELYQLRWGIEEGYKMFKCRAEVEAFTGKTPIAIRQDIFAKVFLMTLCAAYAFPIEEKVKKEYRQGERRKRSQKINRTNALSFCKSIIIPIFVKNKVKDAIEAFDHNIYKTRELIRPGRSFPRKHRKKSPYYMNYKDL